MLFTIGLWFTQAFTEWHQNGSTGTCIFYSVGIIVLISGAWFFMVNMESKIETNKEINILIAEVEKSKRERKSIMKTLTEHSIGIS